jgi:hypothetical protein
MNKLAEKKLNPMDCLKKPADENFSKRVNNCIGFGILIFGLLYIYLRVF